MKKGQLKHLLASALLILPLAFQAAVGVQTVSAADTPAEPDKVSVTLNKLKYDKGQAQDIKNTGLAQTTIDGTADGKAITGKPQAGAFFEAYDITSYYQGLLSEGKTGDEAVKTASDELAKDIAAGTLPDKASQIQAVKSTDKNGQVTFDNLDFRNTETKTYATYAFVEKSAPMVPDTTVVAAVPTIVPMPFYTDASNKEYNTKIQMYPKNETVKTLTKDMTKVTNPTTGKSDAIDTNSDKNVGVQIGDKVEYQINSTLAMDFQSYESYTVVDKPDAGLVDDANSVAVTYGEGDAATKVTDFLATPNDDGGFTLVLPKPVDGATESHVPSDIPAGVTLHISYTATVTKDATPNKALYNTVTVTPGDHTPITTHSDHNPKVGKITFTKIDASTKKSLAGAEFYVSHVVNGVTQYAQLDDAKKVTWIDKDKVDAAAKDDKGEITDPTLKPTTFTSDASGIVTVEGLAYSADVMDSSSADYVEGQEYTGSDEDKTNKAYTYNLVEVKAPDGYALLNAPHPFAITSSDAEGTLLGKEQNGGNVENAPAGILPHTGGMGIYIVIVAGLAIMAAGVFFLRRGKHHEEV